MVRPLNKAWRKEFRGWFSDLANQVRQAEEAGCPSVAHRPWQLRSLGQMEFPVSLSGLLVIRPRSFLPEVRAPGRASGRSQHPEGSPAASTPSSPAAPYVPGRAPWLGSPPRLGGWALPWGDFNSEGGNAEVSIRDRQMRLGSRSACAAAALQRPRPRSTAPRDPKGQPVAGALWPRCRAQSAAHSCSRSTGKTRAGVRRTSGRTASARQAGRRSRPQSCRPRSP